MKLQLRQRDRKALLALTAAAAMYFLLSGVVFPVFDRLKEVSGTVADKVEQLRKYRQVVQRKGHYTDLLAQAKTSVTEAESRLIRGDNPSLASIELQNLVEASAKKENLEIAQKNVFPAKKIDQYFTEMTMTLSFNSTPNQLATFLTDLRTAPKFVTVRNLQLSPLETPTAPPKKGEFKKIVRVSLTVRAVLASPERKG